MDDDDLLVAGGDAGLHRPLQLAQRAAGVEQHRQLGAGGVADERVVVHVAAGDLDGRGADLGQEVDGRLAVRRREEHHADLVGALLERAPLRQRQLAVLQQLVEALLLLALGGAELELDVLARHHVPGEHRL